MKKIFGIFISLTAALSLGAQTLEEGNRQLYYERYASAEHTFHQLLQQNPANAGAWYELTEAYLAEGNIKAADDSLKLAPAAAQSDPYFIVAQGAVLLEQGRKEEASQAFNRALDATDHKNAGVLKAVAESHVHSKNGDAAYAVSLIQEALKREKHSAELYTLLGDAYRKQLKGSEAYEAYKQALSEDDHYALAYSRIGEIFESQKNPDLYVDYFQKAIAADPDFAPALYHLYVYEFYHDPAKAMSLHRDYAAKSDPSTQLDYELTDLYFVNRQYDEAIQHANELLKSEGQEAPARLYKLIGYSYAGKGDTAQAIGYFNRYFDKEADSNLMAKDFVSMGEFYAAQQGKDSLASVYLAKGVALEKDSAALYGYYRKLADWAKERKDYAEQARWLGQYYTGNEKATNLDLFNWGLADYLASDYAAADSVFGLYVAKYPDQSFGYYWQAKSKAGQDKDMSQGTALDAYRKLIEVLQQHTDDPNYKNWMVESYGYLAAYEANTEKDFAEAVSYFEKVLEVDPGNESAQKYIAILEKEAPSQGNK